MQAFEGRTQPIPTRIRRTRRLTQQPGQRPLICPTAGTGRSCITTMVPLQKLKASPASRLIMSCRKQRTINMQARLPHWEILTATHFPIYCRSGVLRLHRISGQAHKMPPASTLRSSATPPHRARRQACPRASTPAPPAISHRCQRPATAGITNLPEMWANDTIKGVYSAAGGISTVVDWNF